MGVSFPGEKRYEGVRFNVSVMMGWVGVKFPGQKHYVTLEMNGPKLIRFDYSYTSHMNVLILRN